MTKFPIGDWRNLTVDAVTNLLLYGQLTTLPNIFDRIVTPLPAATVELDADAFMSSGPRRFALPSLAPFVRKFFGFDGGLHTALSALLRNPQTISTFPSMVT